MHAFALIQVLTNTLISYIFLMDLMLAVQIVVSSLETEAKMIVSLINCA